MTSLADGKSKNPALPRDTTHGLVRFLIIIRNEKPTEQVALTMLHGALATRLISHGSAFDTGVVPHEALMAFPGAPGASMHRLGLLLIELLPSG